MRSIIQTLIAIIFVFFFTNTAVGEEISSISPEQTLTGQTSATIWIRDDGTTGTIDKAWAAITPPGIALPHPDLPGPDPETLDLVFNGTTNLWEGIYNEVSFFGTYEVLVYTMDIDGSTSVPSATSIIQTLGPDVYEEDDTPLTANVITIDQIEAQKHNFHDSGDQDWVMFYGVEGNAYNITTENHGTHCDTVISIYDHDGLTLIANHDDTAADDEKEEFTWLCPSDGFFYVMIKQYDASISGADTGYDLRVWSPTAPVGMLIGQIVDSSNLGVSKVLITSDLTKGVAVSLPNGYYLSMLPSGTHNITATSQGLITQTQTNIEILSQGVTTLNFVLNQSLVIIGDINDDKKVTLEDILPVLKSQTNGKPDVNINKNADVNGDSLIGIHEAIYILQYILQNQ